MTLRRRLLFAGLSLALALSMATPAAAASRKAAPHRAQVGEASYYGPHHAGKPTASGAPMDPSKMIAASKTLPLGTTAKVTHLETGKSVAVTVIDRGPYADDRIIDLSTKAAGRLEMKEDGVAPVKVEPLSIPKAGAQTTPKSGR
jgi:rare lipoprotein A